MTVQRRPRAPTSADRPLRLERYYRAGDLSEDQEWRYRELRSEPKDATP
ncbi:MAG: hypothetical protein M3305_11770 [Actinomycetota bacterium]|nr:hypothetical protein [Actinomycetota bacterium]